MELSSYQKIIIKPIPVKLTRLADRLGVAPEAIAASLRSAGYQISSKLYRVTLNDDQIEIIAQAYTHSIKGLFTKLKKVRTKKKADNWKNFFSRFITKRESAEDIYDAELDLVKVRELFFTIVEAAHTPLFRKDRGLSSCIIELKIVKTFNEIRRKIIATFIRNQFYIFSIDEEPARGKHLVCFS